MPYSPTTWVDGVTPVNAANLNKLEIGLQNAVGVPADTVVAFNAFLLRNEFVGTDTEPAFRLMGNGTLEWGPGGSTPPDVRLYRAFAGAVYLEGLLGLSLPTAGNLALATLASGDSNFRLTVGANGALSWGPGTATQDTWLARNGAGILRTEGSFQVVAALYVDTAGVGYPLYFGSDHSIARHDANSLKVAKSLRVGWSLVVDEAGSGSEKLYFGSALDANLYRVAAGNLKTDGSFQVGGGISVDKTGVGAALYFGAANDVSLSRAGAEQMALQGGLLWVANRPNATDVAFQTGPAAGLGFFFTAAGSMNWAAPGSGADTNLYRVAANALRTDGALVVMGSLWVSGISDLTSPVAGVIKTSGAYADAAIGTALPGSPVDGQMFTLVDSLTAPTYCWQFKYVAGIADAYKWVCIGGGEVYKRTDGSSTRASASFGDAADAIDPTFTCPRAGIYNISFGAQMEGMGDGTPNVGYASVKVGATAAVDADSVVVGESSGGNVALQGSASRTIQKTVAASDVLKVQHRGDTADSFAVLRRWLAVTPMRVS